MAGWMRDLLNHEYWREALTSASLIIGTWFLGQVYLLLVDKIFRRWAARTPSQLDDKIWEAVRYPGYLLILVSGLYGVIHRYNFRLRDFLDGVLFVLAVCIVIYTAIRISEEILAWYGSKIGRLREGEPGDGKAQIPIAEKFFKVLFVVVGLVVILDRYHIDIKSILVTLGVGSLAIGLALQDTLANMFGGFTILVDRPFRVGDRIQLQSGEIGDVQTIGLRATTVLLPDQNLLIVPNALLVKNMVINHSYPDNRSRVVVEVGVAYGSDIELVKRLMLEAAQENPAILQTPPPSIVFNAFGQSALLMTLTCNLQSYKDAAAVKDDLNSMIDGKFRAAGIEIPFPSQTVYLRNQKQL